MEPALTAAWHAVWLTVGPAVMLAALAACTATCTPTFNCALATDFAAIAATTFKNMSAGDVAHVLIATAWIVASVAHTDAADMPMLVLPLNK